MIGERRPDLVVRRGRGRPPHAEEAGSGDPAAGRGTCPTFRSGAGPGGSAWGRLHLRARSMLSTKQTQLTSFIYIINIELTIM